LNFLYKNAVWVGGAVSTLTLGLVFVSQYGFDLKPCVLCIYQRWPYVAAIAITLLYALLRDRINDTFVRVLMAISFAVTGAIAAFHVGVEQKWWEGTAECSADTSAGMTMDQLREQLLSAPLVKCDEVAWEMFGISMAGYNLILAIVMCLFMLLSVSHARK